MNEGSHIRVLAVQDLYLARLALTSFIEHQPDIRLVGAAETGDETLELYDKHKPALVLVDLRLADMNGVHVTTHLVRKHAQAHVLCVNDCACHKSDCPAVQAGALGCISKDVPGDELVKAIRLVAAGHHYPIANQASQAGGILWGALTARERDVLHAIVEGHDNREIARRFSIGEATVRIHVSNILLKLGVKRRAEAAAVALQNNLLRMV